MMPSRKPDSDRMEFCAYCSEPPMPDGCDGECERARFARTFGRAMGPRDEKDAER